MAVANTYEQKKKTLKLSAISKTKAFRFAAAAILVIAMGLTYLWLGGPGQSGKYQFSDTEEYVVNVFESSTMIDYLTEQEGYGMEGEDGLYDDLLQDIDEGSLIDEL